MSTEVTSAKLANIHIDDLAEPRLSPEQQAAKDAMEQITVSFDEQKLLDDAVQQTGLEDFGEEGFRERLQVLLQAVEEDTNQSSLGRYGARKEYLRYLCNRLRIQALLQRRPEIHDVQIKRPIIVAGLPRSGTTHLLNLMSADTRFRSLPLWESYEPIPVLGEGPGHDGLDPRYLRAEADWQAMKATMPLLMAMHPMSPQHIHEEIELQAPDIASYLPEWTNYVPRWRDYYLSHDQTPHYEYMKTVLKILQWYRGPHRWVLKSPQHMEQLKPLLSTFPDATVVLTHRDPVAVIQSTVTMLAYGNRMRCKIPALDVTLSYWRERIETILRACVRDRDSLPEQQSMDVLFHQFMADDIATVESIYNLADIEMTDTARAQLTNFMKNNPRGKHGQVIYDLPKHFGITAEEVRRSFDFYCQRFAVKLEVA